MTDGNSAVRADPAWFVDGFRSCPIMAVFRGLSPVDAVALATVAWDLGVLQVEVPIESTSAVRSLHAVIAAGRDRNMRVGAGTILSTEQLRVAVDAGAAYAVSPGFDISIITLADRAGLPVLPGVATAGEILRARAMGFVWLKAFPASVLGPAWFSAMAGPFPAQKFVGTGGVTGTNAKTFLAAGAAVVGVGSAFAEESEREQLREVIAAHNDCRP